LWRGFSGRETGMNSMADYGINSAEIGSQRQPLVLLMSSLSMRTASFMA
jgi:hypothetical protein